MKEGRKEGSKEGRKEGRKEVAMRKPAGLSTVLSHGRVEILRIRLQLSGVWLQSVGSPFICLKDNIVYFWPHYSTMIKVTP